MPIKIPIELPAFQVLSNENIFIMNSIVVFLGDGQSDQLYGGECFGSFPKKPIIKS